MTTWTPNYHPHWSIKWMYHVRIRQNTASHQGRELQLELPLCEWAKMDWIWMKLQVIPAN